VFTHTHALQYEAKPDGPDPDFARKMQEVLGGQWGEMTVATQYLLQGWNCRLPGKYKDMLLAIGTEELAHVEMIVTCIDRLLDHMPLKPDAADRTKEAAAGYGQHNPQHPIVNGGGASYMDSMGNPWTGAYVTASGNLMADFYYNATAEMQGRLQVARLWNMTDDPGVREMLRFLLTRDHYHQQQWLAAVEELKSDGLENIAKMLPFDTSFTGRTDIWTFAFQALQQRLSTGYGFAAFWGSSSIRDLPEGKEWAEFASHSHNGYLDTALAMGLPGLLLLIVVLVIGPLKDFHAADRGGNNGPLATMLLQIWLFGLYLSSMESFFLDRADTLWFTFLLAVFGLHYLARFRMRE